MRITRKELAVRTFMILFSALLTVLLIEAALKLLDVRRLRLWQDGSIYRLDKDLIYSLKPGESRELVEAEFTEPARINRQGLRDDEIADAASFDLRIIALGDSYTYGHGVSAEDSFPSQLERIFLKEDKIRTDVINAGVPGYGSDQSYKFYKTRLNSIPHDVLILGLTWNDVGDNIDHPLYTLNDHHLVPLDARKDSIYRLGRVLSGMPGFVRDSTLVNHVMLRLKERNLFSQLPSMTADEQIAWSKEKILLQVRDLQEGCGRDNIKFLIVLMPARERYEGDFRWLVDALAGTDIPVLDTAEDPVWQNRRAELFFEKDPHLRPEGNRVLAEKIHEGLRRLSE